MTIDPTHRRHTGPLGGVHAGQGTRPPVQIPPPPGRAGRAPGTGSLDPDVVAAKARFDVPGETGPLAAPEHARPLDGPAWVGVRRKLAELEAKGVHDPQRLATFVARYARHDGDPKVARAILKQIEHPDLTIGQVGAHTCAATSPQQALARQNPARYFRILTELDADGSAAIGHAGARKVLDTGEANFAAIQASDVPLNERLNMLFQAAGMEYANLKARYDVMRDESKDQAEQYKGIDELGSEHFARDLLENKCDMIGGKELNRRIKAIQRDHEEAGMAVPSKEALRFRALAQLVSEGRDRGYESFFVRIKVPGGVHQMVLDDIGPAGATLRDHHGKRHLGVSELAEYVWTQGGRGGYDPGIATTGVSWGARPRR